MNPAHTSPIPVPPEDRETITAHWFTYAGDGDLLVVSVAAFRQTFPEARLVVVNDATAPAGAGVKLACEQMGVEWRESKWNRHGNLRGTECIRGIMETLHNSATKRPFADIVIKLDPDTLVLGREWLEDFLASSDGMTAADDRGAAYGCCYAIRHEAVKGLYNSLKLYEPGEFDVEDVFIAQRFNVLYPGSFRRIPMWKPGVDAFGNGPHGCFVPYNWSTPVTHDKIQSYAQRFDVINCANRVPADIKSPQITSLMHSLFKAVANPLQNRVPSGRQPKRKDT